MTEPLELLHRAPECTGEWERERGRHWRCSECHTLYHGAPGIGEAALLENSMGRVLKVLATLGQQQRDAGEEPPQG